MGSWNKIVKGIALVGQIGISVITPPVVMALLGAWLSGKLGTGAWLTLVCIVVGLLASASTAYSYYKKFFKAGPKEEENHPVSFREHR